MNLSTFLLPLLLFLTPTSTLARKTPEKVLLSNVKTLTLRKDLKTTHNRVSPVPQLKCIGGNAKSLYEIDVLRCKNQGSAYGDEDIQWTCTASLPAEFKLGSTDVICEGFTSSTDPYVLKGSCGVEYRLVLTDLGEEKYGKKGKNIWGGYDDEDSSPAGGVIPVLFWIAFIAVICWMIYSAFLRDNGPRRRPGGNNNRPGFFGGGGGGGGGGGDGGGNDDPPPPYDYHPPPKSTSTRAAPAPAREGWRPGFWTGALGGAAAGYMAGNRGQNQQPRAQRPTMGYGGNDNGEGSSRWAGGASPRSSGSSSSSSGFGASRHESSGFGGTSRR